MLRLRGSAAMDLYLMVYFVMAVLGEGAFQVTCTLVSLMGSTTRWLGGGGGPSGGTVTPETTKQIHTSSITF